MNKTKASLSLQLCSSLLFLFISCTYPDPIKERNERTMKKYFADWLRETDKVEIQYFKLTDTLSKTVVAPNQIDIFKELVNGKEDTELVCDTTGRLLYFKGDRLLFEAYFSTAGTGSRFDRGVLSYYTKPDIYKTLLTERARMQIDESFNALKKHGSDPMKNSP